MTVNPDAVIKFPANASLIVIGKLDAHHCTFTSTGSNTPGSWGTITLNGSGASYSTIQYATIQYGTEIDILNANNVTIQNCSILNSSMHGININGDTGSIVVNCTISNSNTAHGILVQGGANVTCRNNIINKINLNHTGVGIYSSGAVIATQNDIRGFSWGICAIWGSTINSQLASYPNKNNRITGCSDGIVVYRNSYANLGVPIDGNPYGANSVYDNTFNAVIGISYPDYPSGVNAMADWWGNYYPDVNKFSIGPNAYFYYSPYLQEDPWNGIPLPSITQIPDEYIADNNNISSRLVSSNNNKSENLSANTKSPQIGGNNYVFAKPSSDLLDSLLIGINLIGNNKYTEAKNLFITYLKHHPDNQAAYVYLYNCADSSTTLDLIDYFSSLPKQALKDHQLLLSYLYLRQNNIDKAKEVNNRIIKENANTSLSVRAKLNNFNIELYNENDLTTAAALLNEIKAQSDLSTSMEIATAETDYNVRSGLYKTGSGYISPKIQNTEEQVKPTSYSLSQNYPNPFNPSTVIQYEIPKDGYVTLKIYDILGKEIKTLVNENKALGKYSIGFDASDLACGVYLYKIQAGSFISVKKMILLK